MSRSQSIDQKKRDELDLARKQKRQLEELDARHAGLVAELQAKQLEERRALQQKHVREQIELWRAQGRRLGPWVEPVLEGELPRALPREGKVGHGPTG